MIFFNKEDFIKFIPSSGFVLGVDYGSKHLGLAITNEDRKVSAQLDPIDFYLNEDDLFQYSDQEINQLKSDRRMIDYFLIKWNELFLKINQIIKDKKICACVIGLPLKKNTQTENIQQHVEFFALVFNLFLINSSLDKINFSKIQEEIDIMGLNIEINEKNLFDNLFLNKKIDTFGILLHDERFSTKTILNDLNSIETNFNSSYAINKNFKENYQIFDEENEKFYKSKNTQKLSKRKNFSKLKKNLFLKVKNSGAAVNILNSVFEYSYCKEEQDAGQ